MFRLELLFFLVFLMSGPAIVQAVSRFFVVSDTHVDPDYDAFGSPLSFCQSPQPGAGSNPLGQYGCDSPPLLLRSAAKALALQESADFGLMLGDHGRHQISEWQQQHNATGPETRAFVLSLIDNVTNVWRSSLPSGAPLYSCLGNNDVIPDYQQPTNHSYDQWLSSVAILWAPIFAQDGVSPNATMTFTTGGYYRVDPPSAPALSLLVLDTNIFSTNNRLASCDEVDPRGAFSWLEQQMSLVREINGSVWIVGHIPPGLDHISFKPLWQPCFALRYYQLLAAFSDVVVAQLFGHQHFAVLRSFLHTPISNSTVSATNKTLPPAFLHGALSPVYSNNPIAFRSYAYGHDTAGRFMPLDFSDWVLQFGAPAADPISPLFSSALSYFDMPVLDSSHAVNLFGLQTIENSSMFERYWRAAYSGSDAVPTCPFQSDCQLQQSCGILSSQTSLQFENCCK